MKKVRRRNGKSEALLNECFADTLSLPMYGSCCPSHLGTHNCGLQASAHRCASMLSCVRKHVEQVPKAATDADIWTGSLIQEPGQAHGFPLVQV